MYSFAKQRKDVSQGKNDAGRIFFEEGNSTIDKERGEKIKKGSKLQPCGQQPNLLM